jgi:ribulose-5-phosphate 4-epimerase/fuculose-1-phosphate aldolase
VPEVASPERDVRDEVVVGGQVLEDAGLAELVWGHVSARDPGGRGVWMKAAGLGFDEVSRDDVLLVAWDGEILVGAGPRHREYAIHTEMARALAHVGSVVHCHPPHAIALAATGRPLQAFSHAAGPFAGGVPIFHDAAGLIDSEPLGAELARAIGDSRVLVLAGHGIVAVGVSVGTAVVATILFEKACRLQLLAESAGGVASYSPADAVGSYAHTQDDEHLLGAWRYLTRRARKHTQTRRGHDG